ncbi:uncharacterized protein K489DRAFT_169395 [Dissoconium aciculare CBS 342.82]|uniref:Fungal-type protein kinase domain-containing protein n=1 Tax=Dissoconium aciculare CBS 342.82 TaxID=1314786 RepID=A0A6J3M8K2_9PEZI|nr:uncharacterized protein K489DRAFT_169395 [Dissoconium aciculare CBS 342.82]KAF1823929.1 hypothetical protein K489DRAFT_169395 [Dissoconium aciculare CBS 342.82]
MAPVALKDFLKQSFEKPRGEVDDDDDDKKTTRKKPWTSSFPVLEREFYPLESNVLDKFFDDVQDRAEGRLEGKTLDFQSHASCVSNEGEAEVHFTENIVMPLKRAFHNVPRLWFRCQRSVPNPDVPRKSNPDVDSKVIVDWTIRYHDLERENICVGEVKRPTVIDPEAWKPGAKKSVAVMNLWRELAGYAHYYHVKSAFCYDSHNLLILRWEGDVKTSNTKVLLIPVGREGPSIRKAMYRLLYKCLTETLVPGHSVGTGQTGQSSSLTTLE